MLAIRDKILFLKWKMKVEIRVNEECIKGTTIYVFEFLFFTSFITYIDDLKINANNVIDDILLMGLFFGDLSFPFFSF